MLRRTSFLAVLTLAVAPGISPAQILGRVERTNFPHLSAALHELREAKVELAAAKEVWPAGHKERALGALDDGIGAIQGILSVHDVEKFRGVERTPEFYKKFRDFPRLRASLDDLREARDELRRATTDFNGMKERALDDIEVAIGEIIVLTRGNDRPRRAR